MTDIEEGGNVFAALDADEKAATDAKKQVYHRPVTLYKDGESGEQFFYLEKPTFPGRFIQDLKILYTKSEKSQVREQVLADKTCPEILLRNVLVECYLTGKSENDDPNAVLKDESFRLSGSKIGAIRMRMYGKQKIEAQKQLEDPNCKVVRLNLDIECRLVSKNASAKDEGRDDEEDVAPPLEVLPADEDPTASGEGHAQSIDDLEELLAREDLSSDERKKLKKKLKKKRQQQRKQQG